MALLYEVARARNPGPLNSLVNEIAEALLEMGDSAHRDRVIDHVAVCRGVDPGAHGLRGQLLEAFELHRISANMESCALLQLQFGEGSRRWSLTPTGRQLALERQRLRRSF